MKLGPVTKHDKANKKNLTMTWCREIVPSLLFFLFVASLGQSGTQIQDA